MTGTVKIITYILTFWFLVFLLLGVFAQANLITCSMAGGDPVYKSGKTNQSSSGFIFNDPTGVTTINNAGGIDMFRIFTSLFSFGLIDNCNIPTIISILVSFLNTLSILMAVFLIRGVS